MPGYAPWRQLTTGGGMPVIGVGALASTYIQAFSAVPEEIRPNLWAVAELPLSRNPPPEALVEQIRLTRALAVAEEHVRRGGVGSELALMALEQGWRIDRFHHFFARAHHYPAYGSQGFLRAQSGLDPTSVLGGVVSEFQAPL